MKPTGIVRRIDDLGRIVIPKEIRKTLRIGEGDTIEIFTGTNDDIILKKHSTIKDIWELVDEYAFCLNKFLDIPIIVFDMDSIVIAHCKNRKNLIGTNMPKKLETALRKKEVVKPKSVLDCYLSLNEPYNEYYGEYIVPIITNGDTIGAICAKSKMDLDKNSENIMNIAASFIGKHLER